MPRARARAKGSASLKGGIRRAACATGDCRCPKIHCCFLRYANFCRKTAQSGDRPCKSTSIGLRLKNGCATVRKAVQKLVRQLEIRCSIRLSYGRCSTKLVGGCGTAIPFRTPIRRRGARDCGAINGISAKANPDTALEPAIVSEETFRRLGTPAQSSQRARAHRQTNEAFENAI